jgi:hypothetical protein
MPYIFIIIKANTVKVSFLARDLEFFVPFRALSYRDRDRDRDREPNERSRSRAKNETFTVILFRINSWQNQNSFLRYKPKLLVFHMFASILIR